MARAKMLKTGALITLAGSTFLAGSASGDCPVTLAFDDLKYCIVCEGAGRTYAACKAEVVAAMAYVSTETGSAVGAADSALLNAKAMQE